MKQVRLAGGIMPLSIAALSTGKGSQPAGEVGPSAEVAPNVPSSVLAKRKWDDAAGPSGHKKLKATMSLCALRQRAGLMPITGRLSTKQDMPPTSPVVEAPTATVIDVVVTLVIPAHSPSLVADIVKEAASATDKVVVPATQAGFVMVSLSTVATPLLSVGVETTGASTMPPALSTSVALSAIVLVAMALPSSSSRLPGSFVHLQRC